ncbi:MAG: hpnH [Acidimicrobiaceae bacterium]|nr:hpnH [Acidimicrobiaceae bacterium]
MTAAASAAHRRAAPVFLAPLRIEAFAIRRGAGSAPVERIGMGPGRATAARARLEHSLAPGRAVVLLGVAGALVVGLEPGEVVVASSLHSTTSSEPVHLDAGEEVAEILERAGLAVHHAPVVSSPAVVSGDVARRAATAGGAVAVDMESYWCAPLARRRPFVVVRVVVDVPGRDLWSLATPGAATRAYRSLVRSARALRHWSPVSVNGSPLLEVGDL